MGDIALFGQKGTGKTTAARMICTNPDYKRFPLAHFIKGMLRTLPGITEEHTDGSSKEVGLPLYGGKSARQMLQTLGTEWAQNNIDQNIWPKLWVEHALKESDDHLSWFVCDDARFSHELEYFKASEVFCVGIYRKGHQSDGSEHASEAFPFEEKDFDYVLHNNGSLKGLERQIAEMMDALS